MDLNQRHGNVAELVQLWLARGLPTTTSPGTRAYYPTVLGTHSPRLGEARADALTVEHIEALLDAMSDRDYAASTIRLSMSLLRLLLTVGQRRGVVVRTIADLTQPPADADAHAPLLGQGLDRTARHPGREARQRSWCRTGTRSAA